MVGIPGRSKGCNTCLQRKIKCDQAKPECGNCLKSHRLCGGYKRKLGVVLSQNVTLDGPLDAGTGDGSTVIYQGRWRKSKQQPPDSTSSTSASGRSPGSTTADGKKPGRGRPQLIWVGSPATQSLGAQVSANEVLRQQFHSLFLNGQLPLEVQGADQVQNPSHVKTTSWLLQLQDIVIQTPALKDCATALFAARIGRKNGDMNLVCQSRTVYARGLMELQRALAHPKKRLDDETLAACMALMFYELSECPPGVKSAYLTHLRGALMLVYVRGPEASASPLGHSLFLTLRTMAIPGLIENRVETFLTAPEWMSGAPWRLHQKSPVDELLDAFFDLRNVLNEQDHLEATWETTDLFTLEATLQSVMEGALRVDASLRKIHDRFSKSVSGPLYWPQMSTLDGPPGLDENDTEQGNVFPVSLFFPSYAVAEMMTLYWSTRMCVHHIIMHAYKKLVDVEETLQALDCTSTSSSNDSPDRFELPSHVRVREHRDVWVEMAKNVCQSTEYFMQPKMGEHAHTNILTMIMGTRVCYGFADEDYSRELKWIMCWNVRIKKMLNLPSHNIMKD